MRQTRRWTIALLMPALLMADTFGASPTFTAVDPPRFMERPALPTTPLLPGRGTYSGVESIAISSDGARVVTGHATAHVLGRIRGLVQFRDLAERKVLGKVEGLTGGAYAVALSPDEKLVAYAAGESWQKRPGVIRVADAISGAEQFAFDPGAGQGRSLAFSPDGKSLAACTVVEVEEDLQTRSRRGALRVWDLATGRERFHTTWEEGAFTRVLFSPDGKLLAVAASSPETGAVIRLIDPMTGGAIRKFGRMWGIESLAFSADSGLLAAGSLDGRASIWDVASGEERGVLLAPTSKVGKLGLPSGTPTRVMGLAFLRDGRHLVLSKVKTARGGSSSEIVLWDGKTGGETLVIQASIPVCIGCLAISKDGRTMVSGDSSGTVRIWDIKE